MKKKIWIWNHYATRMYKEQAGRHFWFAKELIKKGYEVSIFCANTIHNSSDTIDTIDDEYIVKTIEKVDFIFIKTTPYNNNGKMRLKNMYDYYSKIQRISKKYSRSHGIPNVIYASSVHPLTLVAGIKTAKKFKIACISEVRDLWPESLIAYGVIKENSIIAKGLYKGEKTIYKKSNSIIMTWEGGQQYIVDKGWSKDIDLKKVNYISNGILLKEFDLNVEVNDYIDKDLVNTNYKNIVYTGSIRKVNNIGLLLDTAKIIQDLGNKEIRFLIYGSGDEAGKLYQRCVDEKINNVIFKGKVDKKNIPSILSKSHINILHNNSTSLNKYGQSQNKFFEYLAAGKCIVQTYSTGYSVIKKNECGIEVAKQLPENIAKELIELSHNEEKRKNMGKNARKVSVQYDFEYLTEKLIKVIEK